MPIALAILWIGTTMLDRTRFGLHIYAVGGNPEAARRAGINVARVRIACFILCSSLAVSRVSSRPARSASSQSSAGRDIVLSGVGAAVVGGVSLFGGRGRLVQAAVGALLISMITNGLGLLGLLRGHHLGDHRRGSGSCGHGRRAVTTALRIHVIGADVGRTLLHSEAGDRGTASCLQLD